MLTSAGMTMGTPAYMSPEQAAADPETDHRADNYAFGCMAYELLAGKPPFMDPSPRKLLAAHMTEPPRPIAELRRDTPPALASLVMRSLAKEAADRPQSAGEIVRILNAVTSGEEEPRTPSIRSSLDRRRMRMAGLYMGAFLAIALLGELAVVTLRLPAWTLMLVLVPMVLALPVVLRRIQAAQREPV
jgi:serine/threonine-protein kinase